MFKKITHILASNTGNLKLYESNIAKKYFVVSHCENIVIRV